MRTASAAKAKSSYLASHTLFPTLCESLPSSRQWKGRSAAVLYTDPSKDGMFAFRLKVPKDYHIPPHTHPKPEIVTVLSGTAGDHKLMPAQDEFFMQVKIRHKRHR